MGEGKHCEFLVGACFHACTTVFIALYYDLI